MSIGDDDDDDYDGYLADVQKVPCLTRRHREIMEFKTEELILGLDGSNAPGRNQSHPIN